jgi:hypothetical protein
VNITMGAASAETLENAQCPETGAPRQVMSTGRTAGELRSPSCSADFASGNLGPRGLQGFVKGG